MIRTYDDITMIDRFNITTEDEAEEMIGSTDIRNEVLHAIANHDESSIEYLRWGAYNAEGGEVVYFPNSGRAGITWGADAQWTDADDADDGLERFFGVDDKEMIP